MPKVEIYNEKLTPSAKEALESTMIEFQELILQKANSIAQKGQTADKEISLRDIIEAKEALFNSKVEKDRADYRGKRLMTYITLSGALYSIVGVALYVIQNKKFSIEKDLGLLVAFTGVITIFLGFAYAQLLNKRQSEKRILREEDLFEENDFELIRRWQIIEKMGSNLMMKSGYSSNQAKSINDILRFLSLELRNDRLSSDLKELLTMRNKILHEQYQLSRHEKQFYLDKADKIIDNLEKIER